MSSNALRINKGVILKMIAGRHRHSSKKIINKNVPYISCQMFGNKDTASILLIVNHIMCLIKSNILSNKTLYFMNINRNITSTKLITVSKRFYLL